jgi:hypothetical protein
VAEIDEVLGGLAGALDLVDANAEPAARQVSLDHDQWGPGVCGVRDGERVLLGGDHHDRLDRLALEMIEGACEFLAGDHGKGHQVGEVARRPGGLLHGALDARRTVQPAVGADDSDDSGSSRHQRTGGGVGPVTEFFDGLLDACLRLWPNARRAVDHPRHRLVAHACELRDVGHHRFLRHGWDCEFAHPGFLTSTR